MPDLGSATFSQTDASNATGTMPSWSGTALPSTIDDAGRALQGAITREWNWRNPTLTSGGAANVQTLTYSVAPAAYYNGQRFSFIAGYTNTGSTTLNVNALGATTIKKLVNGSQVNLTGGEITAGNLVSVYYNSAGSCFLMENVDAIWTQGADVASAATVTLGEGGYFNITGTTTITALAFSTDKAGRRVWLKFAGALTLTHNATSLILPGGANITTAAGDVAQFVSEGSGNFRCLEYTYANQVRVTPTTGTAAYYGARAWVNFNGTGVVAIRASANVTSITDNGTGDYTVNFTTAMADANYAVVATCSGGNGGGNNTAIQVLEPATYTSSAVRLLVQLGGGTDTDSTYTSVCVFR